MKPLVTMRQALEDPNLLATLLPGASWRVWRVLLIAAMGEKLTAEELAVFRSITGRDEAPDPVGRRAGDHQREEEREDRCGRGAGALSRGAVCVAGCPEARWRARAADVSRLATSGRRGSRFGTLIMRCGRCRCWRNR